jgi:hypothetical protein
MAIQSKFFEINLNEETFMKLNGSCHCQSVQFEVESYTPYPFMLCYCSICRKTAGGGGYAINIMGQAETLHVDGQRHVQIYHAILGKTKQGKPKLSQASAISVNIVRVVYGFLIPAGQNGFIRLLQQLIHLYQNHRNVIISC